eukprot:scaffold34_cov271-Prasinococcus_capsulatus_cf.AAC.2
MPLGWRALAAEQQQSCCEVVLACLQQQEPRGSCARALRNMAMDVLQLVEQEQQLDEARRSQLLAGAYATAVHALLGSDRAALVRAGVHCASMLARVQPRRYLHPVRRRLWRLGRRCVAALATPHASGDRHGDEHGGDEDTDGGARSLASLPPDDAQAVLLDALGALAGLQECDAAAIGAEHDGSSSPHSPTSGDENDDADGARWQELVGEVLLGKASAQLQASWTTITRALRLLSGTLATCAAATEEGDGDGGGVRTAASRPGKRPRLATRAATGGTCSQHLQLQLLGRCLACMERLLAEHKRRGTAAEDLRWELPTLCAALLTCCGDLVQACSSPRSHTQRQHAGVPLPLQARGFQLVASVLASTLAVDVKATASNALLRRLVRLLPDDHDDDDRGLQQLANDLKVQDWADALVVALCGSVKEDVVSKACCSRSRSLRGSLALVVAAAVVVVDCGRLVASHLLHLISFRCCSCAAKEVHPAMVTMLGTLPELLRALAFVGRSASRDCTRAEGLWLSGATWASIFALLQELVLPCTQASVQAEAWSCVGHLLCHAPLLGLQVAVRAPSSASAPPAQCFEVTLRLRHSGCSGRAQRDDCAGAYLHISRLLTLACKQQRDGELSGSQCIDEASASCSAASCRRRARRRSTRTTPYFAMWPLPTTWTAPSDGRGHLAPNPVEALEAHEPPAWAMLVYVLVHVTSAKAYARLKLELAQIAR